MPAKEFTLPMHQLARENDTAPQRQFHLFPRLPIEIRIQIWLAAIDNLAHHRVSVLRDPLTIPTGPLGRNSGQMDQCFFEPFPVQEVDDRQALLHTSTESRLIALPFFTGAFGVPKPAYSFSSRMRKGRFQNFLDQNAPGFTHSLLMSRPLEAMLDYYNSNPAEAAKVGKLLQLGAPLPRLVPPLWFNVDEDFLLLPISREQKPFRQSVIEWYHAGTLQLGNVKKLAIEMSRADWDHERNWGHAVFPLYVWSDSLESGVVEWERLDHVKEIALWTREGCEVCLFKHDTQGLLKPREWSFRLDTSDSRFKQRLGQRWANMTWHIVLGQTFEEDENGVQYKKNICQLLRDWQPHGTGWWYRKLKITSKIPDGILGPSWQELVSRSPDFSLANHDEFTLRKVEGAQEGTYLGPSYFPWG